MTYYGGKELAASFRLVRSNTIQIAEEIPEESYHFRPADDTRTVGETVAHIAVGHGIQSYIQRHRIDDLQKVNWPELIQNLRDKESKPRSKGELIALLKSEGEEFATYLEGLPESFLAEPVAMPPGADPKIKSRLELLLSPKEHEMHHRAQLMVMQRMIGLTPHLTRRQHERAAQAAQHAAHAAPQARV